METTTYRVTLYQRGQMFYASYKLPGQKKIGKSLKTTDRPTAEVLRAALEAEINNGVTVSESAPEGITFRQLAAKHLAYQRGEYPKSYPQIASIVNALMVPYFGDTPLSDITLEHMNGWKFKQAETISQGTLRQYVARLRAVFQYAVTHGYLKKSLASKVVKPKEPRKKDYTDKVLTPAEFKAICKRSSPYYESVWELLVSTGIRPSEAVRIQNRDIDGDILNLPGDKTKSGEPRTIDLNETALSAIDALRMFKAIDAKWDNVEHDPQPDDYLLGNAKAKAVAYAFKRSAKQAGLGRHVLYNLRHTFGSSLANNQAVALPIVQDMLGHADIQMTMNYVHVAPGAGRKAVQAMAAMGY